MWAADMGAKNQWVISFLVLKFQIDIHIFDSLKNRKELNGIISSFIHFRKLVERIKVYERLGTFEKTSLVCKIAKPLKIASFCLK